MSQRNDNHSEHPSEIVHRLLMYVEIVSKYVFKMSNTVLN